MKTLDALVFEAAKFATIHHDKPKPPAKARRGGRGVPYVHHCLDVVLRLVEAEVTTEETLAAAVLHDVVEDTYATIEEVSGHFGPVVAHYVQQLTLPEDCRGGDNLVRKIEHQVRMMGVMNWHARMIKIADKTSNVHDLVDDPPSWGRNAFLGYANDSLKVVDAARVLYTPSIGNAKGAALLFRRFDEAYERVLRKHG